MASANPCETVLVGPVVAQDGGFGFDTFSRAQGLRRGFRYRCVDQADYDRRSTLRGSTLQAGPRRLGPVTIGCETLGEFDRSCAALAAA